MSLRSWLILISVVGMLLNVNQAAGAGVKITLDYSRAPDLANFAHRVKATLEDWFPRVVTLLNSPNYSPPKEIKILFDPNYEGVAMAEWGKNLITCSVDYFRKYPNDVGSMAHEMAHIIQRYPKYEVWVTEGIADWIRYYHYEPNRKPSKPTRKDSYKKGYGVAAYFLNFLNSQRRDMIYYLNKDLREGKYAESIYTRLMGKTLDQLWEEMLSNKYLYNNYHHNSQINKAKYC